MDRAEFLNRLEAQLLDVPQAEREEALQYYEDYLNDAGDAGDLFCRNSAHRRKSRILSGTDCGRIAAAQASAAARRTKIGRTAAAPVSWVTAVISPKTATSTGSRRRKSCSG